MLCLVGIHCVKSNERDCRKFSTDFTIKARQKIVAADLELIILKNSQLFG